VRCFYTRGPWEYEDPRLYEDPGNTRTLGIRGPWAYEDPRLYEDPRAIRGPRAATGRNVLSRWGSARTQSSSLGQMSQHLSAPNFSKFTNNLENMKSTIASLLGLLLLLFIFLLLFQERRSSQALLLLLFLGTKCRVWICSPASIPLALRESSVSVRLLLVVCVVTYNKKVLVQRSKKIKMSPKR